MFGIFDYSKPIIDFQNFDISQLGEALLFGLSILVIGMATVFAVLCILWLFLYLFRVVFHDLPKKRPAKNNDNVVTQVEKSNETVTDKDGEIVAVLAAAIAMAESENSGMKFRVVSFRKI